MACSFIYDGKEFATKQQVADYINGIKEDSQEVLEVSEPIRHERFINPSFVEYAGEGLFSKAERNDETKKYELENEEYDSVTGIVIPSMQTRPFTPTDDLGARKADKIWEKDDPGTLKNIRGIAQPVNKDEYAKWVNRKQRVGVAKGTIFHKTIHAYVSGDSSTWNEIDDLYQDSGILKSELSWLDKNAVRRIINKTGTDFYGENPRDKVYTEKTFVSKLLHWAGTADLFIDHGDNVYSLYDLKTGTLNDTWELSFLKYGNTSVANIMDNARNRAKLQLMLYAFIIKAENPNARFRNLELLHIRNQYEIDGYDAKAAVDVAAYLEIIKGVLKNENPTVWKNLEALPHFSKLFDPSSYVTASKSDFESTHPNADPAMILKLKTLELQALIMYDKDVISGVLRDTDSAKERYDKIAALMKEIIELRNDNSISFAAIDTDMGWMDKWLGSPSFSSNPYVKLFYRMVTERKQKARDEYQAWHNKFQALLKNVLKEKSKIPITTLVGGINSKDSFAWAFKKVGENDNYKERLYTSKDAEWKNLSANQQALLTFINDSVAGFFKNDKSNYIDPVTGKKVALANKIITYRKRGGKEVPITNLDLYNNNLKQSNRSEKFQYEEGFFPKVSPTLTDIIETHGYLSPVTAKFIWNRYTTNYFEATFDGMYSTDEAIPMKYLGSDYIDTNQYYSHNLELAVDNFVKQYLYKQHLDEVYAFGQGMKIYLKAKEKPEQSVTFERTIEWFEDSVNLHILGHRQKDVQISSRSFGAVQNGNYEKFNTIKFLRSLKNFFAGPTMWLKPLTSLPNAVFASLVSLKEATRNSFNITGAHSNFTISDLIFGFGEAFKLYLWDGLSDNSFRHNKAYLLMEKFGYLPDSFDWYTRPNQLMTAKNRLFTSWAMLRFHSLPEEVISTAIFVAQLKSMKYKKQDGTTSDMWEGYGEVQKSKLSDGTEYHDISWVGGKRGVRNISNLKDAPQYEDIEGLTLEEVNAIKFLYERMHGGYRVDERVAAEYYIMGEMILQLKKYLPSVLKNIWASRGIRDTQGYLEQEVDEMGNKVFDKDGNAVYKWTPQVIEGRYRILLGMFFNFLSIKNSTTNGEKGNKFLEWLGYAKDESYEWKNLSEAQKHDMYDFFLTWGMFLSLVIGYNKLWDRKDKDTLKQLYDRIQNDFAGYVYPVEIAKNMSNMMNPVATRKAYNTLESGSELTWSFLLWSAGYDDEALTREGNFRGAAKFKQNLHFLSAWHDLNRKIEGSEGLQELTGLDQYYK